jgi:hypothetical protein
MVPFFYVYYLPQVAIYQGMFRTIIGPSTWSLVRKGAARSEMQLDILDLKGSNQAFVL